MLEFIAKKIKNMEISHLAKAIKKKYEVAVTDNWWNMQVEEYGLETMERMNQLLINADLASENVTHFFNLLASLDKSTGEVLLKLLFQLTFIRTHDHFSKLLNLVEESPKNFKLIAGIVALLANSPEFINLNHILPGILKQDTQSLLYIQAIVTSLTQAGFGAEIESSPISWALCKQGNIYSDIRSKKELQYIDNLIRILQKSNLGTEANFEKIFKAFPKTLGISFKQFSEALQVTFPQLYELPSNLLEQSQLEQMLAQGALASILLYKAYKKDLKEDFFVNESLKKTLHNFNIPLALFLQTITHAVELKPLYQKIESVMPNDVIINTSRLESIIPQAIQNAIISILYEKYDIEDIFNQVEKSPLPFDEFFETLKIEFSKPMAVKFNRHKNIKLFPYPSIEWFDENKDRMMREALQSTLGPQYESTINKLNLVVVPTEPPPPYMEIEHHFGK